MLEQNISFLLVVIVFFTILAIFLELKRKNFSGRKALRILAVLGLSIGLLAIITKPKTTKNTPGKSIVYLTEGYNIESLDSLKTASPQLKIYEKHNANNLFNQVASVAHLLDKGKAIDTLIVLGFGLDKEELNIQLPLKFLPSYPMGIIGVDYPKDMVVGDSAWITLYSRFDRETIISVTTMDGNVDSAMVDAGYDTVRFKLNANLEGEHLVKLSYQQDTSKVEESLGICIYPQIKYRVLILNEFPSFETRFLKNWLGKAGHQVTIRNKVSKAKYRYEYVNTLSLPFKHFNANYDLVILDTKSLTRMPKQQFQELKMVINNGTSLIIQADNELLLNKEFKNWFDVKPSSSDKFKFKSTTLPRLPHQLVASRLHLAVIEIGNEILAQKYKVGEGAVLVSLITGTYSLLLQGYQQWYDSYWNHILNSLISSKAPLSRWVVQDHLPIENHPLNIKLVTIIDNPSAKNDGRYIPLIQNPNYKNQWEGICWPDSAGWVNLSVLQDTVNIHWEYVYPTDAWRSLKLYNRAIETLSLSSQDIRPQEKVFIEVIISLWLWYGLMMISLLFLWLEPKL